MYNSYDISELDLNKEFSGLCEFYSQYVYVFQLNLEQIT